MGNSPKEPFVIHVRDVKPFVAQSPDHRELRVMLSPKRDGVAPGLAFGVVEVKPGPTPPPHSHATTQEAWYFLSGKGQIKVGEKVIEVEPGTVVVSPPQVDHQLINTGTEVLRALFIFTPSGDEVPLIVE
ncbi:MAG TPA: cupin domain-containing protein [Chloroflexota bacterium]|nr:cupin domain-containing protein [Chloroflexota bacterium]